MSRCVKGVCVKYVQKVLCSRLDLLVLGDKNIEG